MPLLSNKGKSFQGSIVLGKGFILTQEEALALIDKYPRNKEVLFPYLNGDDLNNSPTQDPSRWVINFFDWSEEKARSYPDCFDIVERLVRPERLIQKDKGGKEKWWQFLRPRKELYATISELDQVMVIPNQACKYVAFQMVSSKIVFSNALAVITETSHFLFVIISSNLHNEWAWKYASRMKADMRYTPTDVFETFPLPAEVATSITKSIEDIGKEFNNYRKYVMKKYKIGLTKLYNLMHKKYNSGVSFGSVNESEIIELRTLQSKIDYFVLDAYGWKDINLNHNFYDIEYLPENDRARFSIHPEARKEILKRLLILNHQRYREEVFEVSKNINAKHKKTGNKKKEDNFPKLF